MSHPDRMEGWVDTYKYISLWIHYYQICYVGFGSEFPFDLQSWPTGLDTFRSTMTFGTWIRSGVSWLRYQSVDVTWHGFWEASIHITHAKLGPPWASGSRPQVSNPLQRGLVYRLAFEASLFSTILRFMAFLKPPHVCGLWPCA